MFKCYTNVTIIYRLCVSDYHDYSIMIFCLIAHHYFGALAFIMYSTFKQCLSMGYVSLLTLSFILRNDYSHSCIYACLKKTQPIFNNIVFRIFELHLLSDKDTTGLFSVTCGPGFGSTTKCNTRPTSTTDSIITSERKHNSSPKSVSQRTSFKAFANDNFVGLPSTPAIKDASVVIDTSTFGNNFSSSKPKIPCEFM